MVVEQKKKEQLDKQKNRYLAKLQDQQRRTANQKAEILRLQNLEMKLLKNVQ